MTAKIGEFEELVLMSIAQLGEDAYGVPIRKHLEAAGRGVAVGALYVTLERLSAKSLVTSREGKATPERGGRAKRYYRLTGEGQAALAEAEAVRARVRGTLAARLIASTERAVALLRVRGGGRNSLGVLKAAHNGGKH